MEEEKLIEAIENVRRDKHQPFRYLFFTFLNGIFYGLGMGLGMTLILGIALFLLAKFISNMVNIPIIGYYFSQIGQIIDSYAKQGGKLH